MITANIYFSKYGRPLAFPLRNATSQLFTNVYLHELDDFIKQEHRERYYLRYCDDFIILSNDKNHLESLIFPIREFLVKKLQLDLHPKKLIIRKFTPGTISWAMFFFLSIL